MYSLKYILIICFGWNLVVFFGVGLMNFLLLIFVWIFCLVFMLFLFKGIEWCKFLGNVIFFWFVGFFLRGYIVLGWFCFDCVDLVDIKFWVWRIWEEVNKYKYWNLFCN